MEIEVADAAFETMDPDGCSADMMRWMGTSIQTSGVLDDPFALVLMRDGALLRTRNREYVERVAWNSEAVICGMHGVFDTTGRCRHVFDFDEDMSEDEGRSSGHDLASYFGDAEPCLLGLVVVSQRMTNTSVWTLRPVLENKRMEWDFVGKTECRCCDPFGVSSLGQSKWWTVLRKSIAWSN